MIRFAGFDVNLQAARAALNRTIDGVLAAALARGQSRFTFPLPTINLSTIGTGSLALGTLTVELITGQITALRPVGTTHHGLEADLELTGTLELSGGSFKLSILGANLGTPLPAVKATLAAGFGGVEVDVDKTPGGIPTALVLGLKHANLRRLTATAVQPAVIGPLLQSVLALLTTVLQAGFSFAAALVPRIPITMKPMVDAFTLFGITLRQTGNPATSSPFITAIGAAPGEALVVATDFDRVNPPPAGDPNQLALLLTGAEDVVATLNQGLVNQGVDRAIASGFIPSVFPGGGFTFHLKHQRVALLGPAAAARWAGKHGFPPATFTHPTTAAPLGAVQIAAEFRAKRGSCWCKVKVKLHVDIAVWPYIDAAPPPGAPAPGMAMQRQQGVHLRMFFDVDATVNVSGYLVMLVELILGPLLMPVLFLVSQVANQVLSNFLPYRRTFNLGAPGVFNVVASSATVNAFTTFALDFNAIATLQGQGDLSLDQFTAYRLVEDPIFLAAPVAVRNRAEIKVDYANDSIAIEDGVVRLAADLR